jgi:poly(glycerol-phosphate) alpha-glucosyltransferase
MKQGALIASLSRNAGGLFQSVRNLSLAMNSTAGDVEVEVFGLADEYAQEDLPAWSSLKTHVFRQIGPRLFGYAPGLVNALCSADLDILHVHGIWMYPSMACQRWFARTHKPYVISPHGMLDPWAVRHSSGKKKIAGWLYENKQLRNAACIRALCDSEAEAIRQHGLRNPICVIPNGVKQPKYSSTSPPPWGVQVPASARVLLYLGRLHPKKGLVNLLQAWANVFRISKTPNDWHLVIAGWDQLNHGQELKSLARILGIDARVHFIGPQFGPDKHACYSHADGFILPSFSEGLPIVILEAWAYGLPVLMTPQCNIPEGFAAAAAIRIEPDTISISEALMNYFSLSDQTRLEIGERGRQLATTQFTWPGIAGQMLEVYRWILEGTAKPDCVMTD